VAVVERLEVEVRPVALPAATAVLALRQPFAGLPSILVAVNGGGGSGGIGGGGSTAPGSSAGSGTANTGGGGAGCSVAGGTLGGNGGSGIVVVRYRIA